MRRIVMTAIAIGIWIVSVGQWQPEKWIVQADGTANAQKATASKQNQQPSENETIQRLISEELQIQQQNAQELQAQENRANQDIGIQRKLAKYTRALVYVGILQALVLSLTVCVIRLQVMTTRDIERPWIIVDIEHDSDKWADRKTHILQGSGMAGDTSSFYGLLVCKNEGKSPAWIDEKRAKFEIVETLPEKPRLEAAEIVQIGPEPIGIGKVIPRAWVPEAVGHQEIGKTSIVYGVVRYRDIFDKRHESIFGYRITPSGEFVRLENKPEYNKNT
jgi:hypothetical protein